MQYGVARSFQFDCAALGAAHRASAAFTKTLTSAYLEPATNEPPLPSLDLLRAKGIPTVSDLEFRESTKRIVKRRKLLLAFIHNDGWTWEAVASSRTTSRSSNLDDETLIDEVVLH